MPLPRWLGRFNRKYINPGAVSRGRWPVLTHVGRTSGTVYHTPLDAYPTADGYLLTVNYRHSDWPRNVMAAGSATLRIDGEPIDLTDPRLLPAEAAYRLVRPEAKIPPNWVGVEECLVMTASPADRSATGSASRSRKNP